MPIFLCEIDVSRTASLDWCGGRRCTRKLEREKGMARKAKKAERRWRGRRAGAGRPPATASSRVREFPSSQGRGYHSQDDPILPRSYEIVIKKITKRNHHLRFESVFIFTECTRGALYKIGVRMFFFFFPKQLFNSIEKGFVSWTWNCRAHTTFVPFEWCMQRARKGRGQLSLSCTVHVLTLDRVPFTSSSAAICALSHGSELRVTNRAHGTYYSIALVRLCASDGTWNTGRERERERERHLDSLLAYAHVVDVVRDALRKFLKAKRNWIIDETLGRASAVG